ncbi:multiple sugar transport system ATP-binding protein [Evansella caseinilytica]|uniref:Multiple sugar transport system ATP-binding protein n=1 Tax=Evansella caseinilytica TaxID=1503961 RepID=A0A1H3SLT1_9BACI|nr:ABC transporter ATP-binding protein [Evansella caseinilytica]SDZ38650.1 multiple sugar transport system ATP-binding protein [Evansella caseinilytica]
MDIRLNQLTMQFEEMTAVDRMTTTINNGELVSLLGPSGCGKSTTLMLLSGLYKPTSGEIFFGDKNVTRLDAEKRKIGMVFQNYALYPHLSVLKNIMFPLRMQKVPKKEARERAIEMAALVRIDHLLKRKPAQLSGGQQQRVAIARALVKKPKLLLLDEPLSNLDARLRLEMREEIRRIQQEVGITAVFVTHDQEEALSISDRVMLMNAGSIQQDSTPQQMYKKPVNEFVASFLGNPPINLMTVERMEARQYKLENSAQMVLLPERLNHERVRVGVRPEDLYLTDKDSGLLSGKVLHIETIGRDTMIRLKIGNTSVRALVDPKHQLQTGDICTLGADRDNIHYFDCDTGERVNVEKEAQGDADTADVEEYA